VHLVGAPFFFAQKMPLFLRQNLDPKKP